MAREKQMVAELKRPKLCKINMSHDAKDCSRAGKPPLLFSVKGEIRQLLLTMANATSGPGENSPCADRLPTRWSV